MAALCGSVLAAIAIGYLLATSYLVLRDDLIGATVARQARLQQAYEDRISALRTQVDRITSRQLLDQRLMESKVDIRRLEKQSSNRHLERLRDGLAESMQTSSLHLDMLRDLKRINAHIVSVAHPILDESGVLIESRLRYAEPRA